MKKRKYETKTYHTFFCIKCHKNSMRKPARGYWNTLKEWTCPECVKEILEEFGYDIPDGEFNKIIVDLEESIIDNIEKGLNTHKFKKEII